MLPSPTLAIYLRKKELQTGHFLHLVADRSEGSASLVGLAGKGITQAAFKSDERQNSTKGPARDISPTTVTHLFAQVSHGVLPAKPE